jgi:AraC family transcriptional regulator
MIDDGRASSTPFYSAIVGSSAGSSRASVLCWPGMRSVYAWIPAGKEPTCTGPGQVGVSFSAHRDLVYETGSRTVGADIPAGSVFVTGEDPVAWLRVGEITDALEVYPDAELLRDAADGDPEIEFAGAARDGIVLAICSVLKRAHTTGATLGDMAASTLAYRLAQHLVTHYGHLQRRPQRPPGHLGRTTIDLVTEYVDAELAGTLALDRLGRAAGLSPFHLAHAFKAATGLAPHQFVTARRMHRATLLLAETPMPVPEVAAAVGLSNVSYFRRLFRREVGVLPGELREHRKIGPSAARALNATIGP